MPDDPAAPPKTDTRGQTYRTRLLDRIYAVALDPIHLEDMMDAWDSTATQTRDRLETTKDDPEIEEHARRALAVLDRLAAEHARAAPRNVLDEIPRSAAFLSDGTATIPAVNRAAEMALGLSDGCPFDRLPLAPEDRGLLRMQILRVRDGREAKPVTLRLRSTLTDSPVILRISRIKGEVPLALVVSTEVVWPAGFEQVVQEAFGLTRSEVEVVRGITLGLPVKEIAAARGRSPETVRSQIRSILAKTETHSQGELVRIVLGLMDLAASTDGPPRPEPPRCKLEPRAVQEMRSADGRRLTWIEFGDPAGRPVLYMHHAYGLVRWPAQAERAAKDRGLRVVVPLRAGFGQTDRHAEGADPLQEATGDYAAVMDRLGLRGAVALTMGADLRFAVNLAAQRPGLLGGIVGCGAHLPLATAAQYDRMDRWHRFHLASARYAPGMLPFLVKASYALAARMGLEAFIQRVNSGSPADVETFALPGVREAILGAALAAMPQDGAMDATFTRECIGAEGDWSGLVRACPVPVRLLHGDQDPQVPLLTLREVMEDYPNLDLRILPRRGKLLFFAEWPLALDLVERMPA